VLQPQDLAGAPVHSGPSTMAAIPVAFLRVGNPVSGVQAEVAEERRVAVVGEHRAAEAEAVHMAAVVGIGSS
jgi:hypothetical protein